MIKRMIDADVLLEWVENNSYSINDDYTGESFNAIQPRELLDEINELAENNAENAEQDPWCYDLDKAPEAIMLFVTDGESYSVGEAYMDAGNNKRLMPYDHYSLSTEPTAWMPIPQAPKGATDVSTDI